MRHSPSPSHSLPLTDGRKPPLSPPTAAPRSKGENKGKEGKKKKTDLGEQEDQEEVHI